MDSTCEGLQALLLCFGFMHAKTKMYGLLCTPAAEGAEMSDIDSFVPTLKSMQPAILEGIEQLSTVV